MSHNLRQKLKKLCNPLFAARCLCALIERVAMPRRRANRLMQGWPLPDRMAYFGGKQHAPDPTADWFSLRTDVGPRVRSISPGSFTADVLTAELALLEEEGGELHLPPGRVELTTTLDVPSRTRIVGTPGKTELVFKGVDYAIRVQGQPEEPRRYVAVEHLRIRHQDRPAAFTAAVCVMHAQEVRLHDLELHHPVAVGIFAGDGVRHLRLESCRVYGSNLDGILLLRDVTDVVLSGCVVERGFQCGLLLADWPLHDDVDVLDINEQARRAGENVGFRADQPGPRRVTIANSTFRANRKMGICTDGGGLIRVTGCTLADNECEGITLDNGVWCCQIEHCHIRGNGRRGFQSEGELSGDFVDRDGRMPDGTSKVKLPGVSMDNAAFCKVEHCLLEGNHGDGVKLVRASYGCTIAHNTIAHNNAGYSEGHPHFGVRIGADPRQRPEQFDFPSSFNRVMHNDIIGHHASVCLNAGTLCNVLQHNRFTQSTAETIERHGMGRNFIADNTVLHL